MLGICVWVGFALMVDADCYVYVWVGWFLGAWVLGCLLFVVIGSLVVD